MKHSRVVSVCCLLAVSAVQASFVPRSVADRIARVVAGRIGPVRAVSSLASGKGCALDHEIHNDQLKIVLAEPSGAGDHDDWPEHKKAQVLENSQVLPNPAFLDARSALERQKACLVERMNEIGVFNKQKLSDLLVEVAALELQLIAMKPASKPVASSAVSRTSRVQVREFSTYTNPSSFQKDKPDRLEGLKDRLRKISLVQEEVLDPIQLTSSYAIDCTRMKLAIERNSLHEVKALIFGAVLSHMYPTSSHIKQAIAVWPDVLQAPLYLLQHGYTHFHIDRSLDSFNTTTLAYATAYRRMQLVKALLEGGAAYDKRDTHGVSPLDIARAHDKIAGNTKMEELFEKYIPRGV